VVGAERGVEVGDLTLEGNDEASVIDLLTSGTIQIGVPILNGGMPIGRIILVGGISDLWPRLLAVLAYTFVGGGIALIVGLIVAWRFQRAITKPLRTLIQAMARIRQDHRYDVSVPDASDREIGELVVGFNRMLCDVRDRDERLEAHRRNLEKEVADRTCELREARDAMMSAIVQILRSCLATTVIVRLRKAMTAVELSEMMRSSAV